MSTGAERAEGLGRGLGIPHPHATEKPFSPQARDKVRAILEDAGYAAVREGEQADIVVFNTCAVRENADNRLYGNLSHLVPVKAAHPPKEKKAPAAPAAGEGPSDPSQN